MENQIRYGREIGIWAENSHTGGYTCREEYEMPMPRQERPEETSAEHRRNIEYRLK